MRLDLVLLAIVAQLIVIAIQRNFDEVEPLASGLAPMRTALAMTATVAISGLVAWLSLRSPRATWPTGLVFVILGGLAAYAWPVSFFFALPIPDAVTEWTFGPALPLWQGTMTMAIEVVIILQGLLGKPGGRRPQGRVEPGAGDDA
jgi:hypothetical protein